MKWIALLVVFAFSALTPAQAPQFKSGATVYIEPMDGYETYLASAITKKHVPLIIVMDKNKADYIVTSNVSHKDLIAGQPSVVVNNSNTNVANGNATAENPIAQSMQRGYEAGAAQRRALGETSVSISVIDVHSSQVVFAHSAGKMGTKQLQTTAEDCAKHLKEFIEKSEKPKK
jgi:hypothetical protein